MSASATSLSKREDTICRNMGLVHSCARRFAGRGQEYDDLFQAGCVGLIKAVDGFEEERGLCFSTYAVPVILGEIKRLFREGGTVKVSRALKELSMQVAYAREKAVKLTGQEPTVEELAQQLQREPTEIAQAIQAGLPALSLTFSDDEEEGEEMALPEESFEESLTDKLALTSLMERLPEQDRKLLRLRYWQHRTQQDTAGQLALSQVQVSRREKKLLSFLREQMNE